MHIFSQWARRAIILAGLTTFTAMTPVSHAQYESTKAVLRVPFAFDYGARHFKPGTYTIIMQGERLMMVRSLDGANAAMAMIQAEVVPYPLTQGKAVFRRADGVYALREIWLQEDDVYLHTILPKVKKHAALASGEAPPVQVELALLNTPAPEEGK